MRNWDSCRCWRCTFCPCKMRNRFFVNFWNCTIHLWTPVYITRLASNKIFSPSNKIHGEVGQAKNLSAPLYIQCMCTWWHIYIYIYVCVCVCVCVIKIKVHGINNILTGSTGWRCWVRHCTASRKVAGSIPDGVIGIFHRISLLIKMSIRDISLGGKGGLYWNLFITNWCT